MADLLFLLTTTLVIEKQHPVRLLPYTTQLVMVVRQSAAFRANLTPTEEAILQQPVADTNTS